MRTQTSVLALIAVAMLCASVSANFVQITSEFTDATFDKSVLSSWTLTDAAAEQVSKCGDVSLVGGYKVFGGSKLEKTFTLPVAATNVWVSFDLYLIDDWKTYWKDTNKDYIQVFLNKVKIESLSTNFSNNEGLPFTKLCGEASKTDRKTHVNASGAVTSQTVTLSIVGALSGSNAFAPWGIRNLQVYAEFGSDNRKVALNELNADATFSNDAKNWNVKDSKAAVQTCGTKKTLSGAEVSKSVVSIERAAVTGLPAHNYLSVKFEGNWFDSVDINDTVGIFIDGVLVHEIGRIYSGKEVNLCGKDYGEGSNTYEILIPHTASSFVFKAVQNFDQTDESFGLSNFVVSTVSQCPTIYSDVSGKGDSLTFCDSIPNLALIGWTVPIKGLFIPDGQIITLYQDSNYNGKKLRLTQSDFNLVGKQYVLINHAFNIKVEEESQQRLRVQQ